MSVATWEVVDDHILIPGERSSILDQLMPNVIVIDDKVQDPERQQISFPYKQIEPQPDRNEPVELWILDDGQLSVIQESRSSVVNPSCEEIFHDAPELQQMRGVTGELELMQVKKDHDNLLSNQDVDLFEMKQEAETFILTSIYGQKGKRKRKKIQLLNANRSQEVSGSSRDKELMPETRRRPTRNYKDKVKNSKLKIHKDSPSGETHSKPFCKRQNSSVYMRNPIGEKSHHCDSCEKSFMTWPALVSHYRIHTDLKLYSCDLCDKYFRHNSSLALHRSTHTDKGTHSCKICLNSSMRGNSSDGRHGAPAYVKPYPCVLCDKTFRHGSSLARHKKTHMAEKY